MTDNAYESILYERAGRPARVANINKPIHDHIVVCMSFIYQCNEDIDVE